MFDKSNNSTRDFIILVKVNLSFEFWGGLGITGVKSLFSIAPCLLKTEFK